MYFQSSYLTSIKNKAIYKLNISIYIVFLDFLFFNEELSKEISSLRYYRKLDKAKIKKLKKNKIENQKTIAKQAEEIEMKDNEIV